MTSLKENNLVQNDSLSDELNTDCYVEQNYNILINL